MVEISLLGSEGARAGDRPGYLTLIRLAAVDSLTSATGPWDDDLMAPSGLPGLRCLARSRASLAAENAFKCQNAMLAVSPWRT